MGDKNWQMYYTVYCTSGPNSGMLTASVLVGNCNNFYNNQYFDRKLDPSMIWGWLLALVIMGFFTVYFTSQHHGLSYMFLIVDLLLMDVMFWFSGQSCNLNQLTFCTTMWTLYRLSLIITFFMIIVIFIELVKWLIAAKDKQNKKTEFEEFGYNNKI
jgi:predicted ABC-type exoprotein transport system permease subunit